LPLIFSIIVSIIIILTAFPRRHIPGVNSFLWLMLCVIEWTFFYTIQLSIPDPQAKISWTKYYQIGVVLAPLAWLTFSIEYSRIPNILTRRNVFLLLVIPVTVIVLMWTNDYHHIIWSDIIIHKSSDGPSLEYVRNWGFWIFTAYSYLALLLGSFLLVRQSIKGPAAFESQAAIMIIGTSIPFIANLIFTFWLNPYIKFDPTPFAMTVSGVFYAWSLFRFGLFDLLPVAGEVVLEGLEDGVMVLDRADRVVYINPAYMDYAKISAREAIGSTAQEMMAQWPELVEEFNNTKNSGTQQISIQFGKDDQSGRFEMRMSPLLDFRRHNVGRVFILRKVTTGSLGIRALDLTSATARRKLLLMTMLVNGEVISVNEHFLGIFGYTRVEIIEKFSIKLWESGEQRTMVLRKARSEGIENMEIGLIAKSGQKIDVIVSAKSLTINDETYLFFAMREKR
jgi:PAS domain S-box-containing protein